MHTHILSLSEVSQIYKKMFLKLIENINLAQDFIIIIKSQKMPEKL